MKTALDLPDELMREVRLQAVLHGRKLKDEIADLLRLGLDNASGGRAGTVASIVQDPATGLPMVLCRHGATAVDEMTPSRVASILLDQETVWNHEAGR